MIKIYLFYQKLIRQLSKVVAKKEKFVISVEDKTIEKVATFAYEIPQIWLGIWLESLPPFLLLQILNSLDLPSIVAFTSTCKKYRTDFAQMLEPFIYFPQFVDYPYLINPNYKAENLHGVGSITKVLNDYFTRLPADPKVVLDKRYLNRIHLKLAQHAFPTLLDQWQQLLFVRLLRKLQTCDYIYYVNTRPRTTRLSKQNLREQKKVLFDCLNDLQERLYYLFKLEIVIQTDYPFRTICLIIHGTE